ncbi:MAG: class I SAM-dependent methyltransferase [Candidatus Thorarchaeota archaeon]
MTNRESDYVKRGTEEEVMRLELQAVAVSEIIDKEIEAMNIQSGMSILDAGCGSGAITRRFAKKAHPAKVTGVDFDKLFLERARSIAEDEDIDNVEYESGDIDNLTYSDESFDLTYCRLVLMHVKNTVDTVKELRRVTKKGGIVAVSDQDDDAVIIHPYMPKAMELWRRYGQWAKKMKMDRYIGKQLFSILSQAGLERVKIFPFSMYRTQETPEQLKMLVSVPVQIIEGSKEELLKDGVLTEEEFDLSLKETESFGKHPGAFVMVTFFLAIGYVP